MDFKNIKRVLIANRGEIALRIIKTCKKYNLTSIAIYPKEDIESLHVIEADIAIQLEGIGANAYININAIVKIAIEQKADVVIPGYGFLSENSDFALKLSENNIAFAGPSVESVEKFGLKHLARQLAIECNVPVVPGTDLIDNLDELVVKCKEIRFPIILKATAGGGGMGLKVCRSVDEVKSNFEEVVSRGASLFSNTGVFVEKFIENGRHIEVQIFGNGLGDIVTFGERECSIQRRHQKVIEEAPSPFVERLGEKYNLREKLTKCSRDLASTINYKSAGTVEFLVNDDNGEFYFLEMNTRLQVEHGITELIYDVDLVYFMLLQADLELSNKGIDVSYLKSNLKYNEQNVEIPNGHAIEVRVYAENPIRNFAPSPGILNYVEFPKDSDGNDYKIRIDHWIETGGKVSPYFDPLLAKVMVWSPTRTSENIVEVLEKIKIQGPINNIEYCIAILKSNNFKTGNTLTNFLNTFDFKPHLIEFEESGNYTTIQDLPGRPKIRFGVPKSGPADDLSLQLANIIVQNDNINTECLEFIMKGPILKFHSAAVIAFTGAKFKITLNNSIPLPMFTELFIPAKSIVEVDEVMDHSSKGYMAIKGGFPGVANYLDSKSCTPTLNLGGHQGRTFLPGDCLETSPYLSHIENYRTGYKLPDGLIPSFNNDEVIVRMINGPHDTPDIVSEEGLETVYSYPFKVNFNSNRGAIRLDGPSFKFGRTDGGDGGGHPSNILEYPYPCCGLSTVGSVMVLFGVDGATLSGFTCISVPSQVDFGKFGQAPINGTIRFKLITYNDAIKLMTQRCEFLDIVKTRPDSISSDLYTKYDQLENYEPIVSYMGKFLYQREEGVDGLPSVSFRQGGESMIIVDFGIRKFSLFNSGRQYVLAMEIEKQLNGKLNSVECSSGSMCVTFNPLKTSRDDILRELVRIEASIPPIEKFKVPSRIFKLPVCFKHSALDHCIQRYTHSQRPHAPYLPSNVDYLMRANCIETFEDFKNYIIGKPEVVVAVSFLCANPLLVNTDPRLRFLTSKYNPARTSTPQGAIGSGSVSQSIYSVQSPGGYMIWGMTLPGWYWDTFCRIHSKPWPLNNFDQVIYYEVDEEELENLNTQLLTKRLKFDPEETEFDFNDYTNFLNSIEDETKELLERKRKAFNILVQEEENDQKLLEMEKEEAKKSKAGAEDLLNNPKAIKIIANMPANVFKVNYQKGDIVKIGDVLIILEAMKMEIPLKIADKEASESDTYQILETIAEEGDVVNPGEIICIVLKL